MIVNIVILALVTLQRLGELWLSQPQHEALARQGRSRSTRPAIIR